MKQVFNAEAFAASIRVKRVVKLRIGLREAAKQIGISASTLSRIENFKEPDVNTFFNCCLWLDLQPTVFFKLNTSNA